MSGRDFERDLGAEADAVLADAPLDDLVEVGERATADEQDVRRVDREELLVRVLAPALRRHAGHRALEDLQQRLLHALARHVARDRRVVRLARDLVDLVDVDDPGLGLLHVEVGGLDQLEQDVLDVLADVAGLGQRRGVGDGERDVEDARERLREQRLAAARGAEQQDVGLRRARRRSRRTTPSARACSGCRRPPRACAWPPPGRRRSRSGSRRSPAGAGRCLQIELGGALELLVDDLVAEIDALVADVDARPGDQLLDLPLRLAAEGAEELFVGSCVSVGRGPLRDSILAAAR